MNSIVEEQTVLQPTTDRDKIIKLFLDDLVPSESTYDDSSRLEQPEWGSVYHIGAHLAVKHPSDQSFFRKAGEPDYNIYGVSFDDLLTVLQQYQSLVLKTASYEGCESEFLRYDTFDHRLNQEVVPSNAEFVRFIVVTMHADRLHLWCTTVTPDEVGERESVVDSTMEARQFHELNDLLEHATSLYTTAADVIPDSLRAEETTVVDV